MTSLVNVNNQSEARKLKKNCLIADTALVVLVTKLIGFNVFVIKGMSNMETIEQVNNGYKMPKHKDCPDEVYSIMLKCWNLDPPNRPTFSYLQDYFDNFNTSHASEYVDPTIF